jgi:hypothetical protein
MKSAIFSFLVLTTATAYSADNNCLLSEQQQSRLILAEGPKALLSQTTSDCFQRLLKDEIEMLQRGDSPLAHDRKGVIEKMLLAATREEDAKSKRHE